MRIYLSLALLLAACSLTALGSACTNPCTGSSSTGQDATDRNNFLSDNSSLTFSNITFSGGTWTTGAGGSVIDTATGVTFVGCLSPQSPCSSGSSSASVGPLVYPGTWDGGSDPALSGPSGSPGQFPTITITIPSSLNVLAIGLDILNVNSGSDAPYGVIVSDGSQPTSASGVKLPGSVFFGYSSATAITSFTIFDQFSGTTLGIDNVDVGFLTASSGGSTSTAPPATAPEASTMLLVASGFFMLRFARKLPVFSR
jgi:hypothetical protein